MSSGSTYRIRLRRVPREVQFQSKLLDRDSFYAWLWEGLAPYGLAGIHEGTLLTEEASRQGHETESWTVDAGEAPRERDWIASQESGEADLYFETREGAESARVELSRWAPELQMSSIEEQKNEDWDAQWKASFLNSPSGVVIPPFWRIVPPWLEPAELSKLLQPGEKPLKINPGAGFGTGTHETTQLCLRALAEESQRASFAGARVLDFGSGSGILSIGAAILGAQVDGVEIDPLAIDNANENARINGMESRVRFSRSLTAGSSGTYRVVLANILRPVLLEFAEELVARIAAQPGALILSGLIASDVPEVSERYSALLGIKPRESALGEWRSLVWRR